MSATHSLDGSTHPKQQLIALYSHTTRRAVLSECHNAVIQLASFDPWHELTKKPITDFLANQGIHVHDDETGANNLHTHYIASFDCPTDCTVSLVYHTECECECYTCYMATIGCGDARCLADGCDAMQPIVRISAVGADSYDRPHDTLYDAMMDFLCIVMER
jgi:hypothetical protein